jgi:Ca-activated chloride channel homolog
MESPLTPEPARPGRRRIAGTAVFILAAAVLAAGWWPHAPGGGRAGAGTDCGEPARALRVSAAPEIAPVVAGLARTVARPGCPAPVVTPTDPALVSDAVRAERGDRPDVWIPDSTVWVGQRLPAGSGLPLDNPTVATTPVVAAVPADVAGALGWPTHWPGFDALLPAPEGLAGPVRFTLPDPRRSTAAVGVLLGLQAATAGRADGRATLAGVLRAATPTDVPAAGVLPSLRPGVPIAVPATEQQVWAHNGRRDATPLVAVYPPGPGGALDYPYLILATDGALREQAHALLDAVRGRPGRVRLVAAGFRLPGGTGVPARRTGVDPRHPTGDAPRPQGMSAATRTLTSLTLGSRLLAVVDISGSMAERVSGGRSKLDLALGAAVAGLALYPDDTEVGLWTFATRLSGRADHRELAPIAPLGRAGDGTTGRETTGRETTGRERLARALGRVRPVTVGYTGLNDTALAAVRAVRADWDPDRVNSVVLLTDGRDSDPAGITTRRLLRTLRAEDDPARPVFLITVAYGPDSDVASLRAMSRATGGETYRAEDPRRIREVVLDAIGRRACRPRC